MIRAGRKYFGKSGKSGKKALALTISGKNGKVVWKYEFAAEVHSFAAADGKLYIALMDGRLVCLQEK